MFLKEKRDGRVKVVACENGSKKRTYINKEDAMSHTVCTDAEFMTALIEAYEERDVAFFNIPGAYLHAETDKYLTMVIKGTLAEIIVKVDLSLFRKYVTTKSKGNPILYVNMRKALYGMLQISLLL